MAESVHLTATIADEESLSGAVSLPPGFRLSGFQYVGDFDATTEGLKLYASTDGAAFSPHYTEAGSTPVTIVVAATGNDIHRGLSQDSFAGVTNFKVETVTAAGVAVAQDGGPRVLKFTATRD